MHFVWNFKLKVKPFAAILADCKNYAVQHVGAEIIPLLTFI